MIVYTGGTFDLFHSGHVELLEYCHAIANGGLVIVSLNTDDFVERYKGGRPIATYKQREDVLLATRYVHRVIPNYNGEDSKPTILEIKPDVIVIGMDWLEKDYCKQMNFTPSWLNEHRISLCYVPRTRGVSTTALKEKTKND